jgi:Tol biopolymer transport system component
VVYLQRMSGQDSLWLGQIATNTSVQISQQTDLAYGEATFAPDSNSVYFTVRRDHRPRPVLVRQPVLGGAMTELIPDVNSPVTLSPNGQQLAFVRADEQSRTTSIIIADATNGGNERTIARHQSSESISTEGISWSPDGKNIAFAAMMGGEEEISVINVADGSLKKIGGRGWGRIGNLAWLPDGSGVAMIARDDARARKTYIWFLPYPSGEARKLTNDLNLYLMNSLSVSADGQIAALHGFIHSAIWVARMPMQSERNSSFRGCPPGMRELTGWRGRKRDVCSIPPTSSITSRSGLWTVTEAASGR